MIQALLEGRKTQTRRVVKPQPDTVSKPFHPEPRGGARWVWMARDDFPEYTFATGDFDCPYGQPGDLLWVRENWKTMGHLDDEKPCELSKTTEINYPATYDGWVSRCRPSIHMPRWASRLTLEITHIRVQRVQEISEGDARSEGWSVKAGQHPYGWFRDLWYDINCPESWALNPWVWALTFNVHHKNVDAFLRAREAA
jgi:hypothetical protein